MTRLQQRKALADVLKHYKDCYEYDIAQGTKDYFWCQQIEAVLYCAMSVDIISIDEHQKLTDAWIEDYFGEGFKQ